jgi:plasmid stabilization system protein ParE
MRLVLHRNVHSDVDAIMEYYERVAGRELADDFYAELRRFMLEAAERPESFSVRERDLRRVNLHRFPYHFLFRIVGDTVRVLVVRHHRRHPSSGIHRR